MKNLSVSNDITGIYVCVETGLDTKSSRVPTCLQFRPSPSVDENMAFVLFFGKTKRAAHSGSQ